MKKEKQDKSHKKKVLKTAIALHLTVYLILGMVLTLFKVPPTVIFSIIMVLIWGLLVMGYAYYNEREK